MRRDFIPNSNAIWHPPLPIGILKTFVVAVFGINYLIGI